MSTPVTVPRAWEVTGRKSRAELAAEREWANAARRRNELRKALGNKSPYALSQALARNGLSPRSF